MCGVLIIVGGPQYRVGSHRQFVLLSRRLAGEGYPAMRFDYRGMGDAGGAMRSFEDVRADIGAAIEAFQRAVPSLRRIVLWGLCDAASAALLYVRRRQTRDSAASFCSIRGCGQRPARRGPKSSIITAAACCRRTSGPSSPAAGWRWASPFGSCCLRRYGRVGELQPKWIRCASRFRTAWRRGGGVRRTDVADSQRR